MCCIKKHVGLVVPSASCQDFLLELSVALWIWRLAVNVVIWCLLCFPAHSLYSRSLPLFETLPIGSAFLCVLGLLLGFPWGFGSGEQKVKFLN